MSPGTGAAVTVDDTRCIRCGACALLAPAIFQVTPRQTSLLRDPASAAENAAVRTAALVCPTLAIRARLPPASETPPEVDDVAPLYPFIGQVSERVRFRLDDLPWARLDPALASPALRALARQMAFSELATYSATQRFMQSFAEDVDFTEWLSIWFFEETRHPALLSQWLRRLGEPLPADFALRGRVSTPFMKSTTGTLVTNVISEVTAAAAYGALGARCPEPLLAQIGAFIAGDEARHASAFFLFAERHIAAASDPARERLDALKVLHFWLNDAGQVSHPINQMLARLEVDAAAERVLAGVSFDQDAVLRRVTRIVAGLVGLPTLTSPADVLPALKQLTSAVHARRRTGTIDGPGAP